MSAKAADKGFPSITDARPIEPVEGASLEDAVRLIHDLADRVPSSSSFESLHIARQIAEQAESIHALRNTRRAGPSPDLHG